MKNNNDNFLKFLICSIILHLLFIYCFLFGLPSIFKKLPKEQVIIFEMLPISDKSNVLTQKEQQAKSIKNENTKKVQQSKLNIVEEKKSVEDKKTVVKQDIQKFKKIKKAKSIKNDLDSLLKNLEQLSEGVKTNKQVRAQQTNENQQSKESYNESLAPSISAIALIKQQIENNWIAPMGARNLDSTRITLYIAFNNDGTVREAIIKEIICSAADNIRNALVDSVLRAVWQASPFKNLEPKRYNVWKEFDLVFYPSKI